MAVTASGATLRDDTLKAWNQYVQDARQRARAQVSGDSFFLSKDLPGEIAQVRNGNVFVAPALGNTPKAAPNGLIHDWVGGVYIPDTNIEQLLPVIRDYERYKDFYQPAVLDSKTVRKGETEDRFSVVLANKSVYRKRALESDYRLDRFRVNDRRGYSIAETTRIQEISDYGSDHQQILPEGEGSGMIWRLLTIMRFEERDGGVYLEVEAIALSRDIPGTLKWMVEPIVRRVAKASLATSLQQTRDAVQQHHDVRNLASR